MFCNRRPGQRALKTIVVLFVVMLFITGCGSPSCEQLWDQVYDENGELNVDAHNRYIDEGCPP